MIRINLLAAERPQQRKKAAGGGGAGAGGGAGTGALQAYLFLGLFAGGAVVVCALGYLYKKSQIAQLDSQITQAQARQAQLKAIKAQVDAFEAKKRMLDAKVALIEQLKAQQGGPVHLVDEVSKALPDFVWLNSMEQAGNTIRLAGESNGLSAVADFITNLQQSGDSCAKPNPADRSLCYFPTVDLVSSTEANNVVTFSLSVNFQNADAVAKQRAAAAEAAAAAPARAAAPAAPVKKP